MEVEFRRADIKNEIRSLMAFDRRVFGSEMFDSATWRNGKAFWLLLYGKKVGCCAFEENVDFTGDRREDGANTVMPGSLYISTTGILDGQRSKGLGSLMKAWQISYAKHSGFKRIVTNMRKTNKPMIELNKKYGFKKLRETPMYYENPAEATIVMALRL